MSENSLSMNVNALKRADPYMKEIIASATHVALYTFKENEWEKTNIEGALFVYNRNGEPYHSLGIMNRLNKNNLIEPVAKGIEFQLKEPFLLYRNAKSSIYGIWFHNKDECIQMANKLNAILKESLAQFSSENITQNPVCSTSAPSNAPVDIFSMLSKAQDNFNSTKGGAAKSECTAARAPDMTSQSVMDFFAKAGSGATSQLPAVSSLPSPGIFGSQPTDAREVPQLLQRLMSNPAHSVEHIEKQQRSVTPQEGQNANGYLNLDSSMRPNVFPLIYTPTEKHNPQKIPGMKKLDTSGLNGINPLENGLNMMCMSSPKLSSPLADYMNQSQDVNQPKPALMPPTMFTASSSGEFQPSPEPLTRNQLLQAFNYLLKHDNDFVNKLHEGYVKSFSDKSFSVS